MKSLPFLLVWLLTVSLTGCSFHGEEPRPATEAPAVRSVELFLSRTSLTSSEFEQYRFQNDALLAECGRLAGGRVIPKDRRVVRLDDTARTKLVESIGSLLSLPADVLASLPQPGTNAHLADPGQFILTVTTPDGRTIGVETSLDAATATETQTALRLAAAARSIREPALPLCGNRRFYGLAPLGRMHPDDE